MCKFSKISQICAIYYFGSGEGENSMRAWTYRVMYIKNTTMNTISDDMIIYLFYYYNLLNKLVFSFIFVGVFYYFTFNFQ